MSNNEISYQNILLPHAGTPNGDKALMHAIHLAKPSNAHLTILHVVEPMPHPSTLEVYSSKQSLVQKFENIQSLMKNEMEQEMAKRLDLCKEENVKTTVEVISGYPAQEIAAYAKSHKVDLIVMAERRDMQGYKNILKLGNVSRKILEYAFCPVLIVDV